MHLIESTGRLERSRAALARAGWTLPARPADTAALTRGPSAEHAITVAVAGAGAVAADAPPRGVDFVLRRGELPLAYVRAGARADVTELVEAARAHGVPFAFAVGRSRVRELDLAPFAGPVRERARAAMPGPERLWRRARKRLGLPSHVPQTVVVQHAATDEALLVALERAEAHVARAHGIGRSPDAARVRSALGTSADLRERWPSPRTREPLLAALDAAGLVLQDLAARIERAGATGASDADGLDVLLAVGWDEPALPTVRRIVSRRERVERMLRRDGGRGPRVWRVADARERALLERVLERYVARGLAEPWLPGRLDARALRELGGAAALAPFGTRRRARKALRRLARALHRAPQAQGAA